MTFEELQTGDYFRILGISTHYVYRKTSDDYCTLNNTLQPIRRHTSVKKLTGDELVEYLAQQTTAAEQKPKPAVRLKSRPVPSREKAGSTKYGIIN
ncbi:MULTISPECIES: hypothetical protein [Nostoc]|uniref:DNA-binding protein n=1 Tax=Nostoc paludosum FACHB-159 TaxID=2692908 RepID=A0ABR8KI85_9NOSO|nr:MULTISPECIES: hypothetical protein [Nostoc]MBD2682399.1 hypothetical protein [Nostoc sp. FACHB-857]MBD2738775.1 hypothetical protein [Nostoc paludosum FACHB-159]